MAATRWEQARAILQRVLSAPGGEREAILSVECKGDVELRAEIEALLRSAAGKHDPDVTATPLGSERPGEWIGGYKLLQIIGEGGFGSVYMAEQHKPVHRRVALKIIKLGMDTRQVIARFEAERQAIAMMDHPNIARVLDAGATATGRPYFVMELVKGDPITTYCDRNNLTVPERLGLFEQVCHAIQHAHTKGIIHRDLKPGNILVSTQDGRPFAKVIDFGIAKATDHRLTEKTYFTEHRALIGTPEYMSPEQAEGSLDIDTRTDVYSLGVLLYELLTGTTPFDPDRLRSAAYAEVQRIIREVDPPRPSTRVTRGAATASVAQHRRTEPRRLGVMIRGELDWIVMKALEKDRARRYETATSLGADVRRHLNGEPVLAAPPSTGYRVRKFVRRYRAGVAACVGVGVALIAGLAVSLYLLDSEAAARREATEALTGKDQALAEKSAALSDREAALTSAQRAQREAEGQLYVTNIYAARALLRDRKYPQARARLEACPQGQLDVEWGLLSQKANAARFAIDQGQWCFNESGSELVLSAYLGDKYRLRFIDLEEGRELRTIDLPPSVYNPVLHGAGRWLSYRRSDDSRTVLRDVRTGRESPPFSGYLMCLRDDGMLALTIEGKDAVITEVSTGKLKQRLQHETQIRTGAFSNTADLVAVGTSDCAAHVWDLRTGKRVSRLPGHSQPCGVQFSPDGSLLLTSSGDGVARLWDVRSGRLLVTLGEDDPSLANVRFSADGSAILATARRRVRLWNATTWKELPSIHEDAIERAEFSPDGSRIVTASLRGVATWDARTGNELSRLSESGAYWAGYSPDMTCVVAGGYDLADRAISEVLAADATARGVQSRWWYLNTPSSQGVASFVSLPGGGLRIIGTAPDTLLRVWDGGASGGAPVVQVIPDAGQFWASPRGDRAVYLRCPPATGGREPVRGGVLELVDLTTGVHLGTLAAEVRESTSPVFSPDGGLIAAILPNSEVAVWDAGTGVPRSAPLALHQYDLSSLWFSPKGGLLATANGDGQGAVWRLDSGRTVAASFPTSWDDRERGFVAFSPDDRLLVASGIDPELSITDAETGNPLPTKLPHASTVTQASFSADGSSLTTTDSGGGRRIWDPRLAQDLIPNVECSAFTHASEIVESGDGALVAAVELGRGVGIYTLREKGVPRMELPVRHGATFLCFSPDNQRAVTATPDGQVQVWTLGSSPVAQTWDVGAPTYAASAAVFGVDGRTLVVNWYTTVFTLDLSKAPSDPGAFRKLPPAPASCGLAFSEDEKRLIGKYGDEVVAVWDAATGESIPAQFTTPAGDAVQRAAYSKDLSRAIVSTVRGSAYLADAGTGAPIAGLWECPDVRNVGAADRALGVMVTASGRDARAQVWDLATGKERARLTGHTGGVRCVAVTPDGTRIATGSYDGSAKVWDASGTCLFTSRAGPAVSCVAVTPDGQRVVVGRDDGSLTLWEPGNARAVEVAPGSGPVSGLILHPGGSRVVVRRGDAAVMLDTASGGVVGGLAQGGPVLGCSYSGDGAVLATLSPAGAVGLWNGVTGERTGTLECGSEPSCVTVDGGGVGGSVLVGMKNGEVRVFDLRSREMVGRPLRGHAGAVRDLVMIPGTRRLLSCSGDQTLRMWALDRGEEVYSFLESGGTCLRLWLDPRGGRLCTVTEEGMVYTWNIPLSPRGGGRE